MSPALSLIWLAAVAAPEGSGLHLRDRMPSHLTTRGVSAPATLDAPPRLPEGVLDAARYDLPIRYNAAIAYWIRLYTGRGRAGFARKLARKGRYQAVIREALARHKLPRDLEWLVLVESGFSPTAVSGAGAVGLWQLLLPTAGDYGLRIDRFVDERRDPAASSEAGCRLLADLHRRFGSWDLAIAAYNTGIGYLTEAVRRYNNNDFWTISKYGYLPRKTRTYVAMVVAAAIVGKNPRAFGFEGVVAEIPPEVQPVSIQGGVPLAKLARAAGVDRAALKKLNPALRRSRTPPGKDRFKVWIPASSLDRFTAKYDRTRPARPSHKRVVVRYGETLASIARDYGVAIRTLRSLNHLKRYEDPTDQELVVPVPRGRLPKRLPTLGQDAALPIVVLPQIAFDYGGTRRAVLFRVPRRTPAAAPYAEVAERFGVTESEVMMWNGLETTARLQPGMVLRLYPDNDRDLSDVVLTDPARVKIVVADSDQHVAALVAAAHARERAAGVRRKKQTGFRRHTVKRGETLTRIARRYRTTVEALARLNKIDPRRLRPGQVLRIRRGHR